MINFDTHQRVAGVISELPEHLGARLETPQPAKRFKFIGRRATLPQLEVSVANEPDNNQVLPQILTGAFAAAYLIRQDRGRGGGVVPAVEIPLMYQGNIRQPDGRRLMSFVPNTWR